MFDLILLFTFFASIEPFTDMLHNDFPWIGVLRFRANNKKPEALTGVTIIAEGVAIANSYEMDALFKNKELRAHVTATFQSSKREQWYSTVKDIIFHPEHNIATKNSLAIVFLQPASWADWDHIRLPRSPMTGSEDAYYIAFTDKTSRNFTLSITSMDPIDRAKCHKFYEDEGLNSKWMRPVHYNCYRAHVDDDELCLNDAGMVLALPKNDTEEWKLLGISIHGPGCSLPARFIDIFPYISWIRYYLPKNHDEEDHEIIAMGSRRANSKFASGEQMSWSEFDDQDSYILSQISNTSIVLAKSAAYTEGGTCNKSDLFVYADEGKFNLEEGQYAEAIYSVSLYDVLAATIDCVMINITCNAYSAPNVYYKMGFGEEDWHTFVKVQPNPKTHNNTHKILIAQDEWMNYVDNETFTLWLKFDFYGSAYLKAKYYGKWRTTKPPTTTTLEPGATKSPYTRLPRKYSTHLRRTKKPGMRYYTEAPILNKKKVKPISKSRGIIAIIPTKQLKQPKSRKLKNKAKDSKIKASKAMTGKKMKQIMTNNGVKIKNKAKEKVSNEYTTRSSKAASNKRTTKKTEQKTSGNVESNDDNAKTIKHKASINQTTKLNKPLNYKTKFNLQKKVNVSIKTNKNKISTTTELVKEGISKKRKHYKMKINFKDTTTPGALPTIESGSTDDDNYF